MCWVDHLQRQPGNSSLVHLGVMSVALRVSPVFCSELHRLNSVLIAGWVGWFAMRAVSVIVDHCATGRHLCTVSTLQWTTTHYSHHTTFTSTRTFRPNNCKHTNTTTAAQPKSNIGSVRHCCTGWQPIERWGLQSTGKLILSRGGRVGDG